MTAEQLAQLREVAERAASDDWGHDHDDFCESLTPGMILALLDELEAADRRNAELEALLEAEVRLWTQRYDCANIRREAAEKSNAFLKDQLDELANFNPDWDKLEASYESWREIAAELLIANDRIAELEARAVTLPDVEKWRPVKEVCGQYSYRALVIKSLSAAGIKCEVKGE